MRKTKHVYCYETMLISKEKVPGSLVPRDFGGMESGGMEYRTLPIGIAAKNDKEALALARACARREGTVVLWLRKIVFERTTSKVEGKRTL